MKMLLVLMVVLATSYGCREYETCDGVKGSCTDDDIDFSCADACDKLFLVCGFEGFGNDIDACNSTCLAEPPATRNLICYRDATCVAISQGECVPDNNDPYQAYRTAGGPHCGADANSTNVFCMPGDNCVNPSANTCGPPSEGRYQAYRLAGGPLCGQDPLETNVFCEPGDSCIQESANTCQ